MLLSAIAVVAVIVVAVVAAVVAAAVAEGSTNLALLSLDSLGRFCCHLQLFAGSWP